MSGIDESSQTQASASRNSHDNVSQFRGAGDRHFSVAQPSLHANIAQLIVDSSEADTAILTGPGQQGAPKTNQASVAKYLERMVITCRTGKSTRSGAVREILNALDKLTDISANTQEKAFTSYLVELQAINRKDHAHPLGPSVGSEAPTNVRDGDVALNAEAEINQ